MASKIIIFSLVMWMCCSFGHSIKIRDIASKRNGPCDSNEFRCLSDTCIRSSSFCNGVNNCGDNSDEEYCRIQYGDCPNTHSYFKCSSSPSDTFNIYGSSAEIFRCIPIVWKCNGINDCPNGDDEYDCETQAISVMALVCAGNQPGSSFSMSELPNLTMELKQKQYRNGTVENLQTTALVMQALFASETEDDENNFDTEKAFQQILREQKEDGSFGSVINTYYVLPVLNSKSLVNISSENCTTYSKDEETALQDLMNLSGSKIRVRYSLWIGNDRDVEKTLKLKVPSNSSFYGVMEVAKDIDSQFRFQYVMKNGKPYINAISGIQDDPESGRFWFPYILNSTKHSPVNDSPADLIPKDNDHVIMWYQIGSWIE